MDEHDFNVYGDTLSDISLVVTTTDYEMGPMSAPKKINLRDQKNTCVGLYTDHENQRKCLFPQVKLADVEGKNKDVYHQVVISNCSNNLFQKLTCKQRMCCDMVALKSCCYLVYTASSLDL